VQSWDLREIDLTGGSRSPVVLFSRDEARAVLIGLDPGQELGEHQVRENAFLVIIDGVVQIGARGGGAVDAGAGTLVCFEPHERRVVSSADGARVLLVLAPWPGAGHYWAEERTARDQTPESTAGAIQGA
jgi:quercetin dioxygenase-like cupin family protein